MQIALILYKKILLGIRFLIWSILYFILIIEYLYINTNVNYTLFLEIQLFVIYIFLSFSTIRKYGLLHLFTLYFLMIGLFSFMGIFFTLFTDVNYKVAYTLIDVYISEDVAQKMILIYMFFLVTSYLSYNFFYYKANIKWKNIRINICIISRNERFLGIGKFIMLFFLIFVLYRSYLEFKMLYGNRNLLFISGTAGLGIPLYLRVFTALFQTGYLFIITSFPPKKTFIFYSLLYIFTIIPGLLIGNRMMIAIMILYILWMVNHLYNYKINIFKLFLWGIIFLLILQLVAIIRSDGEIMGNIGDLIKLFFVSQSTTIYVLALYIQYHDLILNQHYPFILDSLIGGLTGYTGQSLETLEVRSSLGHQMIYSLNPDYYLNGFSLGTSSIAELYEFGIIGVILGAIFLSWIIVKFNFNILRKRIYLYLSFILFSTIIASPRAGFFPSLYDIIKDGVFFLCILFIFQVCNKLRIGLIKK